MSKDLMKLTAVELGKKIKDKEVTVVEATKACLERIKALDETYNCFVTVDEAGALAQAEAVQAKIDSGGLPDRWLVFRLPSRITCVSMACLQAVLPRF